MRYVGSIYRPPCEAESYILQATIGCPYNKCAFCVAYKQKSFSRRPLEDVKEDVDLAKEYYGDVRSVFVSDGNSIILPTDYATELLRYLYEQFPNLEHVGMYGGAKFINLKTKEDLVKLREAGLSILYMGLESGYIKVLELLNKGVTPEEMIQAAELMHEAELPFSVYVLMGAGGAELSKLHAEETAKVLSAMDPPIIRPRTLNIRPGTPIEKEWREGRFVLAGRHRILLETQTLLNNLQVSGSYLISDHATNYLPLYGWLPDDREKLLEVVKKALEPYKDRDPDETPAVGRGSEEELWKF